MKYVMFTVGWEVRYNMRDEALSRIDYFVDNSVQDEPLQNFFGKPICSPTVLQRENSNETIIIIGSLTYRHQILSQIESWGGDWQEGKNVYWAPNWHGDDNLPPFYYEKNQWIYLFQKNIDYITTRYFKDRAEIVYEFIEKNPEVSVLDVGAGGMFLKNKLPKEAKYIPVDFIPYSEDTLVANLDEYEFPNIDGRVDYVILGDTLVHVRDWKWLLRKSAEYTDRMIVSLVPLEIMPDVKQRADHGWVTHIYSHELILYLQSVGFYLKAAKERHGLDNIYLFERGV